MIAEPIRRACEPLAFNGDAHLSETEGEQASASDPLPYVFKE